MQKIKNHLCFGAIFLFGSIILGFFSGKSFVSMHKDDSIFPSHDLSENKMLSEYFPKLKKTPGDTPVFIFHGEQPGRNILILGGAHPNEPAGTITAVLLTESIQVQAGKVIIIPWANHSGFTHNDPFEGSPQRFSIKTQGGKRWFKYGSRLTNPIHQWPDPIVYINPSGQKLAGTECRNLNRSYPGKRNGNLTERIAFGIMEVLKSEKIDLAIDLHEAAPEYPVINAIVFHENSAEISSIAFMDLQLSNFEFRLEASPPNLRGLSHREWGDFALVKAVLLETANVSHGRLKGKPSASLITEGKDKNYVKAGKLGRLFVPFREEGIPLKLRVARHLASVEALISAFQEEDPAKRFAMSGIPSAERVKTEGIGHFLTPPK
ncbi:succinylglutamate desuccinylase/aspartoacylase family protein [Acidobacteriota bacterium]